MPADGRARGPMGGQRGGTGTAGQPMGAARGRGPAPRLLLMGDGGTGARTWRGRAGTVLGGGGVFGCMRGVFGSRRCPFPKGPLGLPGGLAPAVRGLTAWEGSGGSQEPGEQRAALPHNPIHSPDGPGEPQTGLLRGVRAQPQLPASRCSLPQVGSGTSRLLLLCTRCSWCRSEAPAWVQGSGHTDVQGNPPVWWHCKSI